jgi:hypothetical protein
MVNAARKALGITEKVQKSREAAGKVVNLHSSDAKKAFNGSSLLLLLAHSEPNAVRYHRQKQEQSFL